MKTTREKILREDGSQTAYQIKYICTQFLFSFLHNTKYPVHYHTEEAQKNLFSVNQKV